jgi:hypothetical protein
VSLAERRDLLGVIMKSPGPFYQFADGSFYQDTDDLDEQTYLDTFENIPVYEATGRVDFEALVNLYFEIMRNTQ